jgi:L-rhamnose-H+ transport protein
MIVGIAWAMLGALFLGTFALPSKYIKNFAWENTWGAFFLFGMLVVPVGISWLAVKGLWATYSAPDVSTWIIFVVMALGFLWGCGFCCWGYGLSMVGLSMGYALTMGTMALLGSMIPFLLSSVQYAATLGGVLVIGGILISIAGVGVNGFAGVLREKSQATGETEGEPKKKNFLLGLVVCVVAGVLSSGLNIAFHVGGEKIGGSSKALGNPAWLAGLSVWTLIFLGGMISSVGFSVVLLCKNKTWKGFGGKGSCNNLILAFLMAVGGFAIFQSGSLIVGNCLGFFTGEWKGASKKSRDWLVRGLAVLILGIVIASCGTGIIQKEKTKKQAPTAARAAPAAAVTRVVSAQAGT